MESCLKTNLDKVCIYIDILARDLSVDNVEWCLITKAVSANPSKDTRARTLSVRSVELYLKKTSQVSMSKHTCDRALVSLV